MASYDHHENADTAAKLAWQAYENALINDTAQEQLQNLLQKWRTAHARMQALHDHGYSDSRRRQRKSIHVSAEYQIVRQWLNSGSYRCKLLNISQTGFLFASNQMLAINDTVLIRFDPHQQRQLPATIQGTIVRIATESSDTYSHYYGCIINKFTYSEGKNPVKHFALGHQS